MTRRVHNTPKTPSGSPEVAETYRALVLLLSERLDRDASACARTPGLSRAHLRMRSLAAQSRAVAARFAAWPTSRTEPALRQGDQTAYLDLVRQARELGVSLDPEAQERR